VHVEFQLVGADDAAAREFAQGVATLFTIRTVIDEYTYDKQKAPQTLQDLVTEGYRREIPVDPMTGRNEWRTIMEDPMAGVSQMEPGLFDVKSLSEGSRWTGVCTRTGEHPFLFGGGCFCEIVGDPRHGCIRSRPSDSGDREERHVFQFVASHAGP
jgi:hypothetical protein